MTATDTAATPCSTCGEQPGHPSHGGRRNSHAYDVAPAVTTDETGDVPAMVELVREAYLTGAADCRQDDLAAFITEAREDVVAILDELMMTAADLKIVAGDWYTIAGHEQAPIYLALQTLANTITDGLTVADLERRLQGR